VRNHLLRWTVSRLLAAAPVLTLAGCGYGNNECGRYSYSYYRYPVETAFPGATVDHTNCGGFCEQKGHSATGCSVDSGGGFDGGTSTMLTCRSIYQHCNDGRRPEGLRDLEQVGACCEVGALFAQMAYLEAASVPAFLRLADELATHGAPRELVRAARRSAGDEVRHARAVEALASRHGVVVPAVALAPFQPRPLEAMALENAVEGCVRETYGAVVAGWQARNARDEQVRAELARIAEDELRHAELAWAVDTWASGRLAPAARERLREARHEALRTLEGEVAADVPAPALVHQAGMPAREHAIRLVQGLRTLPA
jgi:hypothetical protein